MTSRYLGDEWFEITEDLWRDPRSQPRKLELCADASVPAEVVRELRSAGIAVISASEVGIATHSDRSIWAWSKRERSVLLSMDRDFWNDRKFPLSDSPGVIFVDVPPSNVSKALEAFGLIFVTFAQSYSLDGWQRMKARVTPDRYFLKMRTWEGKVAQYEIKIETRKVVAREV